MYQRHGRRAPAGVAHVGFRIMHYHGVCIFDQIHFVLVDIDAVSQKGLRPQDVPVVQTVNDPLAVLLQTLVEVINSLGHMDMISHALRLQLIAELHGFIGDRKGCVHAHHCGEHIAAVRKGVFDKVYVFHYRFF